MKIAEDGKYEIITAAQGVINRLQEAEAQKKTPTTPRQDKPSKSTEQPFQARRTQRPKTTSEEKGSPMLLILAAVIVVIAVILFLLMG